MKESSKGRPPLKGCGDSELITRCWLCLSSLKLSSVPESSTVLWGGEERSVFGGDVPLQLIEFWDSM